MAEKVLMPKLGAAMEVGTIIEWIKNEGDQVSEGEPILEIMTDKINMEIESPESGVLLKILYGPDEEVPVFEPIAFIGKEGEYISEEDLSPKTKSEINQPAVTESKKKEEIEKKDFKEQKDNLKIRRTPAARRRALELGINLNDIKGSGPNRRIHLADVEAYAANQHKLSPLAAKMAQDNNIDQDTLHDLSENNRIRSADIQNLLYEEKTEQIVPYNGIRKMVGQRMKESWNSVPHVTLNSEIDMTEIISLRSNLLTTIEKLTGYRLSYTEIIMKTTATALKSHPTLNASLNGNNIKIHSNINLGIAVAVPNGLMVPVIRDVDRKGLARLTKETKLLTKNIRENKAKQEDLVGGTFSISNLGMYAVDSFTPIINPPQTAILGIGQIKEKVVKVNNSIDSRPFMTVSLSFDHRIIDGAPAAEFLTEFKKIMESPYILMA